MQLYEWEIWHTYTSYIETDEVDLVYLADHSVESGMAYLALHRDGMTVWRVKEGVGKGHTIINSAPGGNHGKFTFTLEPGDDVPELSDFAEEAWWQACHFRLSELRLFGTAMTLPHPYVRLFLGQCNLTRDDECKYIRLYPTIVIFESGVVILEFRTISPDHDVNLSDFITGAVNLFQEPFDSIHVPPALSKLASRAWYHSGRKWKFHQRAALLRLERGHDLAVAQRTSTEDGGDFSFDLAPLSSSDDPEHSEQLSSLALTIFHTVAYIMGRPRKGWRFLFYGQQRIPEIGGFWSGRPHIHLIRFQDQRETAEDNEDAHAVAFRSIMLRSDATNPSLEYSHLPADNRIFQDFSCYISSSLSLWVWSLSGLRQQEPFADANRGHLIYEHQSIVELLEYGYMLHRALLQRVSTYAREDEILSARQDLLKLEQEMAEASPFGEIIHLLERGWNAMGLEAIRSRIRDSLEIRGTYASLRESRLSAKIGRALSILFGLIAVPPIAEHVLKPLWKVLKLPRPTVNEEFSLLLIGVSVSIVAILVLMLLRNMDQNNY
ncbi:MAG TPA: hypothetical protein DCG53_08465 [Syntrophus sp. (in: bacteria)]|jgi:hypothetical protein|nr:hypothetical protein [Syntrophus sp. (in: bacteria)]